jgi:Flp pilus assembly protein TadB
VRYRWDPAYPSGGRRTSTNADAHLRASDAERNEVADKLSRHFAEGRLDQAEFKVRLDKAMGATTRGDLDGLFDDLPRLATEPPPPAPRHRRLVPFVIIVALVATAAGTSVSAVHVPWLAFVLIGLLLWRAAGHHRADRHRAGLPWSDTDR